jgi:hypothetical protein
VYNRIRRGKSGVTTTSSRARFNRILCSNELIETIDNSYAYDENKIRIFIF